MFLEYTANKRLVVLRFGKNQESIVSGQRERREERKRGKKDIMNEKKKTKTGIKIIRHHLRISTKSLDFLQTLALFYNDPQRMYRT